MIHLVLGPPCAGKTTYIAENKKPDDIVYDFDALGKALGSPTHVPSGEIRRVLLEVRNLIWMILQQDKFKVDVWVHKTDIRQAWLDMWRDVPHRVHLIDPGIEVCLERAEERDEPDLSKSYVFQWYDKRIV